VKFPEPGKVKTRIARDTGPDRAVEVYRQIAAKVIGNTLPSDNEYERIIFYWPGTAGDQFRTWLPGEKLLPQRGADIGERMALAIRDMLCEGASKAVIAGVDIPELHREIVRDAFSKLDKADVVIGPALDGGYYLIGMKALHERIFQGISWSTDKVLGQTILAVEALNVKWDAVATLSDVDTLEDLLKFDKI